MIKTVENRTGKSVYGILQVGLLVLTPLCFKPASDDMRDDFRTMGLIFLMWLLSLQISLIAAPLAFGLSFAILAIFYSLAGQFTDVRHFSPFPEGAFIFLYWLGMFICGYWQWFGFPQWSKNLLRTICKAPLIDTNSICSFRAEFL